MIEYNYGINLVSMLTVFVDECHCESQAKRLLKQRRVWVNDEIVTDDFIPSKQEYKIRVNHSCTKNFRVI